MFYAKPLSATSLSLGGYTLPRRDYPGQGCDKLMEDQMSDDGDCEDCLQYLLGQQADLAFGNLPK